MEMTGKHLSAKELLRSKGIYSKAWNKWEETSQTLPKTGAKQFEPNGSWLQNKQIENGLESRKFLLGIERVNRSSQLASAEWLPEQKKARVTKKSSQEWANFGLEVNGTIYLIPEEALILLETECLELTWDGVPMSIQQAYEILIDSEASDCTLAEYRAYSQLTRLGYRLQRFYYSKAQLERTSRQDDGIQRKKVIVDPENGLWMARNNVQVVEPLENHEKSKVDDDVKEIVEDMMSNINDDEKKTVKVTNGTAQRPAISENSTDGKQSDFKRKNGKIEIISEQTISSPIKILKDIPSNPEVLASKWPGARIQRNVKLLPKRNDKSLPVTSSETSAVSSFQMKHENVERISEKRRQSLVNLDSPESKKSKHEIIEVSDDEIEEIPRPMTRMEMLNCLPNIAAQVYTTENISRRYIPRGVRPQRSYRYDSRTLRRMHDSDKALRTNGDVTRSERRDVPQGSTNENESSSLRNSLTNYQQCQRFVGTPRQSYSGYNNPHSFNRPYIPHMNQFTSNSVMINIPPGICLQQNVFQNVIGPGIWQNPQSQMAANRWSSFQMNFFRNGALMAFAMRNIQHQLNNQQSIQYAAQQRYHRPHRYLERPFRGSHLPRVQGSTPVRQIDSQRFRTLANSNRSPQYRQSNDEVYQTTFIKLPGTSSWPELKQKWRDAKTITIEDEDSEKCDLDDSNEIQVVGHTVQPLIGPKNARSFAEIYERLRIIKSAPEKTVRRKKSDFKISYNVYSSTQHYKKSNPGMPMFHLVVTSRKESEFLQPIELNRLQQDGKGAPIMFANVSHSSIAYIQPGIVSLPNLR